MTTGSAVGIGSTAVTTLGTITTGTWNASLIGLVYGGTNANNTASNGGIAYSTASAISILAGTATAQQLLLSGASTTPQWSTTTYPLTNAINTLLYASSANVMSALATANSGVLITSAGGAPSISSTLPGAVQGNITAVGTIGTGVWQGTVVTGTYGGTGVNNSTSTITIGGNVTFSGAHTFTGTLTGNTSVTFPTSGTLATSSGGAVVANCQSTTTTTRVTTTSTTFVDLTGMSVAITPSSASNQVLVFGSITCGCQFSSGPYFQIVRTATPIGVATGATGAQVNTSFTGGNNNIDGSASVAFCFLDSPATTSATTYKIQWFTESGTAAMNQSYDNGNFIYNSTATSTITVMEVV